MAIEHFTVLDLTHMLSGPNGTMGVLAALAQLERIGVGVGQHVDARCPDIDAQLRGHHVQMPGNPIELSAAQPRHYTRPPKLSEQTQTVLGDLVGYGSERLAQLMAEGSIA